MTNDHTDVLLQEIEKAITQTRDAAVTDARFHALRKLVCRFIDQCFSPDSPTQSLGDAVALARGSHDAKARRKSALLLTRLLDVSGAISLTDSPLLQSHLAELLEVGMPDIAKALRLDAKRQTFEKLELLKSAHSLALSPLDAIAKAPRSASELVHAHQGLIKALSSPLTSAYVQPYGGHQFKDKLNLSLAKLRDLTSTTDNSYTSRLVELKEFLLNELQHTEARVDFLAVGFICPLYAKLLVAVQEIEDASRERFKCDIRTQRVQPDLAPKRYPLHRTDRAIKITVGLENLGPGIAQDVQVELSSRGTRLSHDDRLILGNVTPGPFALVFEVLPIEPTDVESMALAVSWAEVGTSQRKEEVLDLRLVGQDPCVDWPELEAKQPYSTAVAEGEEFFGRQLKVKGLGASFLKQRMTSSYITGQKRVGKTSLARAVEAYIKAPHSGEPVDVLYEEYGLYSRMDPVETVQALGVDISTFLSSFLPDNPPANPVDFHGSLAPLARLADRLSRERPEKRFLVILDEFDEIPPEMYRFGRLAEAFFSNLRALSAKTNLAFLLVGGERMPFVMSAQGDQLNKFVRVQLDYFDRVNEWQDFEDLICNPTEGKLSWSSLALSQIFDTTNGHPYYTKLLCNRVYSLAVSERDTDITETEVSEAAFGLARELDTNAFAHIWKDGIQHEDEQAEAVEARRRRFLCAVARTLREGQSLTDEAITQHRAGLRLDSAEIPLQLRDFLRRGFMTERGGHYRFSIPLFHLWLAEHGVTQILSDALSEEYELAAELAEDKAFVSQSELIALTNKWHVYQGQNIGPDRVRAFLDQLSSNREKRLLFKLLQHIRFFSTAEIRERLKDAHSMVTQFLRPFVQHRKIDRRSDVLVTYADGVGKSGARYASLYAEENRISSKCVVAIEDLERTISHHEAASGTTVTTLIFVDDFLGTGDSLSKGLVDFFDRHLVCLRRRNLRVFCVVIAATSDGEQSVRTTLKRLTAKESFECDLRVCENIATFHFAFSTSGVIWSDQNESDLALSLCRNIGARVQRAAPLGYGDNALLVVFPDTCPNNSLPILHSGEDKEGGWQPLFPRIRN